MEGLKEGLEDMSIDEVGNLCYYACQPTVHGNRIAFIREDDVWLIRDWAKDGINHAERLTTDGCCSWPLFSPDGQYS